MSLLLAVPVALVAAPSAVATNNCSAVLYATNETPGTVASDTQSVELGVKFTVASTTTASAIRFYRPVIDTTGYHVHLWDGDGNLLASGSSAAGSGTGTGWVQVSLTTSVSLTAETTYVASYQAKNGRYQYAWGGYAAARTSSLLSTPVNAGVYKYYEDASAPQFPTQFSSSGHTAYFVTPVLGDPDATAIPPVPPGIADPGDTSSMELGVKFTPAADTTATAVRFYRGVADSGGYSVHLWNSSGTLLASGTNTGATGTGWVEVNLSSAVNLSADTTYTASYHASNGGPQYGEAAYAAAQTDVLLATPVDAGVYKYTSSAEMPTSSYGHNTYYVSPVLTYEDTTAPATPASVTATPNVSNVNVGWNAAVDTQGTQTVAARQYDVYRGTTKLGTVGHDIQSFVDADQPAGTYAYTVKSKDDCGNSSASSSAASATVDSQGLFDSNPLSAATANDSGAITVGVKFTAATGGEVRGAQFYRGTASGSSTTVGLWNAAGTLLASATPASGASTGPGWVTVLFSSPVSVTAATTYTVGYYTSAGAYSVTPHGLDSALTKGDLTALASGGVYTYGTGMVLPASTYNNANYWAAPVFAKDQAPSVSAGDIVYWHSEYVSGSSTPEQIYIRHSDGSTTNLTNNSYTNRFADVSPDGSRIAFISQRPQPAAPNQTPDKLYVMNSDGSGQLQLFYYDPQNALFEDSPRWSPDGTKLVFTQCSSGGTYPLCNTYTVNAYGSGGQQLTTDNDSGGPYAWSPTKDSNGDYRIVYTAHARTAPTMTIMDSATGGNKHSVSNVSQSYYPDWSPDGTRIYYSNGNVRYLTSSDSFTNPANSTDHGLTSSATAGLNGEPRISADGNTVVFTSQRGGTCCRLFVIDKNGGTETAITPTGQNNQSPAWVKASWSPKKFAVIGDSYSSGEGNPDFDYPTGGTGCHRSQAAYAHVLGNLPAGLSLAGGGFAACSGATSYEIINGKSGESSQFNAITSNDDLVILTVGGNNVGFPGYAAACVYLSATSGPGGGCGEGTAPYNAVEASIEDDLPAQLDVFFGELAPFTTSKRVLVLGYPKILPPTGASYVCSGLNSDSRAGAMLIQAHLNSAISDAVGRAQAHGQFEFVSTDDTGSPFIGHELCSDDPYFHGVNVVDTFSGITFGDVEYSYHPNVKGQAAYARLVFQYLSSNP